MDARVPEEKTMLQLQCPWCGPCDEQEFTYVGKAHIQRPPEPDIVNDKALGDYGFCHTNTRGLQSEQWCHTRGCRRCFNVARDTETYRVHAVYRMGEPRPGFET